MKFISPKEQIPPGQTWKADFQGCYARFEAEQTLIIGNQLIERSWQVKNGLLFSRSLRDLSTGTEWLSEVSAYPVMYPHQDLPDEPSGVSFTVITGSYIVTEEPSLVVELKATGEKVNLIYRFQVFTAASGVTQQLLVERNDLAAPMSAKEPDKIPGQPATFKATGIETPLILTAEIEEEINGIPRQDLLDFLPLSARHLRLTQVTLLEQTDFRNEIVFENEWLLHTSEKPLALSGNLFIIQNTLTRSGLIFLKMAPLPSARPFKSGCDLLYDGPKNFFSFFGHGLDAGNARNEGYAFVILSYSNGRPGWIETLQNYQRQLRSFVPGRDGLFLSNTWGDRSRDGRISHKFIEQEIKAAALLGVDVLQIDDGWQTGTTANSVEKDGVWEGFWDSEAKFWQPHPQRLPGGLPPLINQGRELGIQFGLWFGADSAGDFTNWRRDADTLLELYKSQGIKFFKIDAIKMVTETGERNLQKFFRRVLVESGGEVVLELDVTADIRPGYFGMMGSGPIFVENRYTDWHNYWPHQTLRNFWKLAHYVDPLRLRIEFLNNNRNQALYKDDPLAPVVYRPAYLFATTMFANPLGFFEISNLSNDYIEEVGRLVKIWKEHRAAIWQARTFPVGDAPDGTSWMGFISIGPNRQSGYALIFRELNVVKEWTCSLPVSLPPGRFKTEILWGEGSANLEGQYLGLEINAPLDFLFLKFQAD